MAFVRVLVCAAGIVALAGWADAQVLYATTASGAPGELFLLNPATGALVRDVGPTNDANGVTYGVSGLAFTPVTGLLYGSTGNATAYDASTRARLVTINPATGRVTAVGPFNVGNAGTTPSSMSDLAFTPSGSLFGVGTVGGAHLYSINLATGQATRVGDSGLTGTSGGGLAISPAGVYFGTPTASRFGTYSPTTGAYTNITAPTLPAGGSYAALAFDGSGTLFGLNSGAAVVGIT